MAGRLTIGASTLSVLSIFPSEAARRDEVLSPLRSGASLIGSAGEAAKDLRDTTGEVAAKLATS